MCQIILRFYIYCIIVKFLMIKFHNGEKVTYDELESLNATCSSWDTCSIPRDPLKDNLLSQHCECKDSCKQFDTCCLDAPAQRLSLPRRKTKTSPQMRRQNECYVLDRSTINIFATTKCLRRWRGNSEIKELCENSAQEIKDPIAIVPVTNSLSGQTYKNYFCAFCNDDNRHIEFWNINIQQNQQTSTNSSPDVVVSKTYHDSNVNKIELLRNLVYDDMSQKWGTFQRRKKNSRHFILSEDENTDEDDDVFEPVSMTFQPSTNIREKLTSCHPNLISDCDSKWTDETVRSKCRSYMGMIYSQSNSSGFQTEHRYKNIHCAICNFADGGSRCLKSTGFGGGAKPSFSFAMLLDINTSDGGRVGEVSRCEKNELYDPFFKKCRAMVCGKPGYKIKNGKCQPS